MGSEKRPSKGELIEKLVEKLMDIERPSIYVS
jgi:hypothetical protein